MDIEAKRRQVIQQCKAVIHMATVLAQVRFDYVKLLEAGQMDDTLDIVGAMTAMQMESLGDILNGMDAVTEDGDWMMPVFDEAHRLWPSGPAHD